MGAKEEFAPLAGRITDWNAVIECASANSVIPLLARSLAREAAVPLASRRHLDKWYSLVAGTNAKLARELDEVLRDLGREGIQAIAYKGPALAMLAYGDLTARNPSADLDLLLHKRDITRAKEIVEARGYRSVLTEEDEEHFFRYRYHFHFEDSARGFQVELHWALSPSYWRFPLDCWSRVRPVTVAGAEVPALDRECSLLAVCAHGAKEGWPKLSQVLDVAQLVRAPGLDWNWVFAETRRIRRERVLYLGLYLASRRTGVALPDFIEAELARDPVLPELDAEIASQFGRGYYEGGFRDFAVRVWHHPADRLRYLGYILLKFPDRLRHLARPSEEDRKVGEWKPLQVVARPFRAVYQRGWSRAVSNARRTLWQ